MTHSAFFGDPRWIDKVYAGPRRERIAADTRLYPQVVSNPNLTEHLTSLRDLEVIFSTWGMPALTPAQLDMLPNLRAVFYAAGSVQGFARPLLEKNLVVCSAWRANAVPVAEYTLAQILLSCKRAFANMRACTSPASRGQAPRGAGVFGETVAILGAGAIGRLVIGLLRPFTLRCVVFDPFLSDAAAAELGVTKVTLAQAFQQAYVVSNHIANLPTTKKMLRGEHFASMRQGATFINTGRGATVDEPAMIDVLRQRPDLTALLDVTDPEPPVEGSPLYTLPNVFLTTHIAGSLGDEVMRMGDYMIAEYQRWKQNQPLEHQVSLPMLATMA